MPSINTIDIYDDFGSGDTDNYTLNQSDSEENKYHSVNPLIVMGVVFGAPALICLLSIIYYKIKYMNLSYRSKRIIPNTKIAEPNIMFIENPLYNSICSICLDDNEELKTLGCGHSFHEACITTWIDECHSKNISAMCPTCRGTIEFNNNFNNKVNY